MFIGLVIMWLWLLEIAAAFIGIVTFITMFYPPYDKTTWQAGIASFILINFCYFNLHFIHWLAFIDFN